MKIQVRLMASILPVVILVVMSTILVISFFTVDYLETLIQDNAKLLSQSYSIQLNNEIKQLKNASDDLSSATITSINIETTLIDARKRYPEFEKIFYTSSSGFVIDLAPFDGTLLSENFSIYEQWNEALNSGRITISDPGINFDIPSVIIYSPVKQTYIANSSADIVGVLCIVIPLQDLFDTFENITVGDSGYIAVIDSRGRFLQHSNPELIFTSSISQLPTSSSLKAVENAMVSQLSGFAIYYEDNIKNYLSFSPITQTNWSLGVFGNYDEITRSVSSSVLIAILSSILGIIMAAVVLYFVVHPIVIPIEKMTAAVESVEFEKQRYDLEFTTRSEVGILSRALKTMVEKLQNHNEILEDTVEKKTIELTSANAELSQINEELIASNTELNRIKNALWSEIELAHKLQSVLLPEKPKIHGFDISAYMKTTSQVGGDYYDVIHVDGMDWFVIGDVSGHGVTAGLIMMMVQTSIHIALNQNPQISPESLLTLINKIIHENIHRLGEQKYMTLTIFAVHNHGHFSFSGAHLPLIIYRASSEKIEFQDTPGAWIGLINDIDGKNGINNFNLEKDDTLLLYTDGITESTTLDGENFDQNNLADLFRIHANKTSKEIKQCLKQHLKNLVVDDDVTLFIIKRVG